MAGPAPERLTALYTAFNGRDTDTLLEQMTPDVDWPNAWEGAGFAAAKPFASTGRASGRRSIRP